MEMKIYLPNCFINEGGIKLPIGYRFHPTDEELLVHYLKRKVFGLPLPASIIPEFDVFQTDPWSLPGDVKEKRFFFRKEKRNWIDKKVTRFSSGCGYWNYIGRDRQITNSENNQVVGMKKKLIFSEVKFSEGAEAQWVMHQYRLVGSPATKPILTKEEGIEKGVEEWVVYRVFQKRIKRPKRQFGMVGWPSNYNKRQKLEVIIPSLVNYISEAGRNRTCPLPQPCSSCCSSDITEVSSNGQDEEEISAFISFPSCSN